MVQGYNGANFGWYLTKAKTLSGIFLKFGSFDGTELIFPFSWYCFLDLELLSLLPICNVGSIFHKMATFMFYVHVEKSLSTVM
jgi:hypothetical protein